MIERKSSRLNVLAVPADRLPIRKRTSALKRPFSADYAEVLVMPAESHGFVIHDPAHLRLIALDSYNYYILAERGDRVGIGIIQGREDAGLYIFDFADGSVRPAGHRSIAALRNAQAVMPW